MFSRVLIICSFLFVLAGCLYNDEPMPEIVYEPKSKLVQAPKTLYERGIDRDIPRDWIPPKRLEKRWLAVVVHHSATRNGNAALFDKWHREGNRWEGIGYDFVIGNGTDSGDGRVEATFRWREQIAGAHCGGTRGNWANKYAVGICLVGNFNQTRLTSRQMGSLVKLIRFLQNRYGIPKNSIYGHKTTPGAVVTDCPGKTFSMAALKSMLDN